MSIRLSQYVKMFVSCPSVRCLRCRHRVSGNEPRPCAGFFCGCKLVYRRAKKDCAKTETKKGKNMTIANKISRKTAVNGCATREIVSGGSGVRLRSGRAFPSRFAVAECNVLTGGCASDQNQAEKYQFYK